MSNDEHDDGFDLVEALRGTGTQPPDATLGGYMSRHDRPVAFEGADGEPYTVDVGVEELLDGTGFASFLLFVRWAATGAGIMDHRESDDVAVATSEEEVRAAALALPLARVKELLDEAIRRGHWDEEGEDD